MIEINNIYKQFENDCIRFKNRKFEDNTSYVILGPSGCGKSTLLNVLSGHTKVSGGQITACVDGRVYPLQELAYDSLQDYRRAHISYVSQDFNLFEEWSVGDNLRVISEIKNTQITIEEALKLVGLEGKLKQKVKTLSGGEKQRVCIARALLQQGHIILCDEPTGSLNQKLAVEIIKLIITLHKKMASTLIVVTHDERLAAYFDEVIHYEELIQMSEGGRA